MNVKDALTRKIGPLPAWGWGVALGGALLAFKMLRGGVGGPATKTQTATVYVPTGNEVGSTDFASQLGEEFADFRQEFRDWRDENANVETPQNNPPSGEAPARPHITLLQGKQILAGLGLPTTWATSRFAADPTNAYIWNDPMAFRRWALRAAAQEPKYATLVRTQTERDARREAAALVTPA